MIPGRAQERHRLGVAHEGSAVQGQAGGAAIGGEGVLGGARMQYHPRQSLTSVDAILFDRPEILVTFAAKFDEKTLELTDQPTIDIVKQQLAAFDKFIRRVNGQG
jgi:NAD(P)H-dependent FMN reductase